MNVTAFVEMTETQMVRDARRKPRLLLGDSPHRGPVERPSDVAAAWPELPGSDREVFGVLLLNARHEITRRVVISIGSLNASIVHPREVFKPAILYSAAAIIAVHNHPSGNPEPSDEDIAITERLKQVGEVIGIRLLDHVVIATGGNVSLRQRQLL